MIETAEPVETERTSLTERPASGNRHLWAWIVAWLAMVLVALTFRPVIEGDGVGYYSFLHAVLVSHRLDWSSEYAAALASHTPLYRPWVTTRDAAGHLTDYFPVGSAVLSLPAYLIALALHPSGEPQYGSPFVEAFTLASLLYGLVALGIGFRLAVSVVRSRRGALVGVTGALVATPFIYYLLSEPSYAHTFSVFCVSAFLYVWWKGPPESWLGWFGLGALGGLMTITRFQDGALLAILLIDFKLLRWPALLMIPGFLLAFLPQAAADQVQFASWLPERPPGQALDPLQGRYLQILFSSQEGLLVWTPIALAAVVGGFLIPDRRLKLACLIAVVVEFAVIGSAPDTAGAGFGPRRFLELTPFAIVAISALAVRIGRRLDWAVVGAFSAWNLVLITNYEYVMAGVSPRDYGFLATGQISALVDMPRLLGKGAALRDLLAWPQSHVEADLLRGVCILLIGAGCVAAGIAVATRASSTQEALSETTPAVS